MRAFRGVTALVSVCGLLAAAAPLRARADVVVLAWQPGGAPSDVNDGVQMGASEAQQTATLLGRSVRLVADRAASAPVFATILSDSNGVSLKAGTCTFRLAPSETEKRMLLASWKTRAAKEGEYRIAVWHPSLKQFGGSDLNERFTRRFHQPMTDGAWLGWAAVKAAVEAALRASGAACPAIEQLQFDAHKGAPLSFVDRVLRQPLYVVEKTAAGERVVSEVQSR